MPAATALLLDREPLNVYERELVSGFSELDDLEEIWVREVAATYPIYRVYLAFSAMTHETRTRADQIAAAYQQRRFHDRVDFDFIHMPHGRIPADIPARIYRRPSRILLK